MTELRLRKRHRMRQKEIEAMTSRLNDTLGSEVFSVSDTVDMAEGPGMDAVFVNGRIVAVVIDGEPFLTVRGLLAYGASKRHVTVDMGAVKFVVNGADVMAPGIVDADMSIAEGDLIWIRDERNRRPLAIARALMPASKMMMKEKGKAAASLHYVGDKLWALDETDE